ncbi:MAG: hypothetical protein IKX37_06115 [Bacteroidales bacterium]|nr:hypothetical protein [Bacteroidales bacterium]
MKKLLYFLAIPALALSAFACKPEEVVEDPIQYSLTADEAFVNGVATITVTGSKAAAEDVTISIGVSEASMVAPECVIYEPALVIPAGATTASMTLTIPEKNLKPGLTGTVTVVASYNDLLVDQVLIAASRESLNGAWAVIGPKGYGDGNDIPMVEDEDGWYIAEDVMVEGDGSFKFRKDGAFDVALGIASAETPEFDELFDLVDWDGCYGIAVPSGTYSIAINPDLMQGYIHCEYQGAFEARIEREWGKYPDTWPAFTNNLDRNAAMDDEYIYVVQAGAGKKGIWAIPLTDEEPDLASAKQVNVTGIYDEGTFYTSCVKTIPNPATGKRILLVCNLAMAANAHLYLYAYDKGIDQAPTVLLKDYVLPDWAERRFGDFFTVVGDWSNGYVWFRTNTTGARTTARWKITNGALASQTPDGFNYGYGASEGKGAFYQLDMSSKMGLLITPTIGLFYDLNSGEGQVWSGVDQSVFKNHFGFTPFEYKGRKFLAFVKMFNAARAWLTVIETTDNIKTDLETYAKNGANIYYQAAIQIAKDGPSEDVMSGATYTDQSTGSCDVVVKGDDVYLMGHLHNVGLSLFKFTMRPDDGK